MSRPHHLASDARKTLQEAIARIIYDPAAVVGHFDEAAYNDHAPVTFVDAILEDAAGADPYQALNAMVDVAKSNSRVSPWGPVLVKPS